MLPLHLLQDENAIRGKGFPPAAFENLRDRHEKPVFNFFRLQGERTCMPTAKNPSPDPIAGVFKIVIKKRGQGNPGDAEFFGQLARRGVFIGLRSQHHAASRHVPVSGIDILGGGSFLDKDLLLIIEDQDITRPMDQPTTAHEMTGQGINHPVVPINYLHYFPGWRVHDFLCVAPQPITLVHLPL